MPTLRAGGRSRPGGPGSGPGAMRRSGGGASGARDGVGALREAVDRWDEGAREREQAQGDELRSDARGGASCGGGGRGVVEQGTRHRCGGGRALWGVVARRRVARGVAPSRGPVGSDSCGDGALGGGATRGGRCARAPARMEAPPQGREGRGCWCRPRAWFFSLLVPRALVGFSCAGAADAARACPYRPDPCPGFRRGRGCC